MKMKKIVRNILGIASIFIIGACEDSDEVFDQITGNETRGAVLRTSNLISNELPIGDDSAIFEVELEVQDQENGTLVDNVEIYVGFNDNTDEVGPGTNVAEQLYATVNNSEFTVGEFGLPRFTVSITLNDMLSFVGRNSSDITGGDNFPIRFALNLTDGRRYTNTDNSGTLTGAFFSSPFLYTPTVVCPIAEDAFVGSYVVNTDPGSGPGGGAPIWDADLAVELVIGETSTQRVLEATYLPTLNIGNGPAELAFDLVCGEIVVPGDQASGLACAGNPINWGPPLSSANGSYDVADDSTFTVVFNEDEDNGCGGGPDVTATLVKM